MIGGSSENIIPALIVFCIAVPVLLLGGLPGHIARKRNHPNATAITICGWLGWLTFGIMWLIAMVWAFTNAPGIGDRQPAAMTDQSKRCPFCAELIQRAAMVCKHCGRDLAGVTREWRVVGTDQQGKMLTRTVTADSADEARRKLASTLWQVFTVEEA